MTVLERLSGRHGGLTGKRALLVFAVLAAFLLQSFLTATHFHVDPGSAVSTIRADHLAVQQPTHRPAPTAPDTNCPICHAVAQAGHYLASAPIVFVSAASAAIWLYAAAFRSSVLTRASHAWNSRAPPQ
jgi:hypothetical protein